VGRPAAPAVLLFSVGRAAAPAMMRGRHARATNDTPSK
jgi:hypothetical protein